MGRHRNRRATLLIRQVAVAAAVLTLVGGILIGYQLTESGCAQTVRLTVGAAPELTSALRSAATSWERSSAARVDRRCVTVTVTAADSSDIAAAIAGREHQSLAGLGKASGSTTVPDVWVPDSSVWLQRLRAVASASVPAEAPSIARSPVVLAAPEPVATALGWPDAKLSWADLLAKVRTDTTLHLGIVDPGRDAASLASLVTLTGAGSTAGAGGSAATASNDQRAAVVAALRALASGRSVIRDDLLRRFPTGSDPVSLASALSVAPLPEHAILAYNAKKPPVRVVGVSISPNPPALDYPYAVLPEIAPQKADAAADLRTALAGFGFRDQLASAGLRASDGTVGAGFSSQAVLAIDQGTVAPVPDAATADQVLATWSAITAPARMLAILDISGSMLEPVPTAGNASRMAVTVEAARRGLALFDEGWAVGLWTFSTQLDGDRDYRPLVPIGPLSVQRDTLNQTLASLAPKPTGDTALYDTVLAGYRAVQEGWDPGRVNSVVLLTDGENDDTNGLSIDQLLDALKTAMDPKKPIQVILIGIGTSTSEASMRRITDVTGGGVFIAQDPANIGQIFLQAIALRATKPG